MRWLGKGGLGLLDGGLVRSGQPIPSGGLTPERIMELHAKGLVDLEGEKFEAPKKKSSSKKRGKKKKNE